MPFLQDLFETVGLNDYQEPKARLGPEPGDDTPLAPPLSAMSATAPAAGPMAPVRPTRPGAVPTPPAAPTPAPPPSMGFWDTLGQMAKHIPIRMGNTTFSVASIQDEARKRQMLEDEYAQKTLGHQPMSERYPGLPDRLYPPHRTAATPAAGSVTGLSAVPPGSAPTLGVGVPGGVVSNTDTGQPVAPPQLGPDVNAPLREVASNLPSSALPTLYSGAVQQQYRQDALEARREQARAIERARMGVAHEAAQSRMDVEKQRGATRLEQEKMRQEGLTASDKAYAQQKLDASLVSTKTRFLQALGKVGVPPDKMAAVEAAQDMDSLNRAYTEASQTTLVPVLMPDGSTPYVPAARAQRMLNEQASLEQQRKRQDAQESDAQKALSAHIRDLSNRLGRLDPGQLSAQPLYADHWASRVAYANLRDKDGNLESYRAIPRRTLTGAQLAQNLQAADPAQRAGILHDIMDAMVQPSNGYLITGLSPQEVLGLARTYGVRLY